MLAGIDRNKTRAEFIEGLQSRWAGQLATTALGVGTILLFFLLANIIICGWIMYRWG